MGSETAAPGDSRSMVGVYDVQRLCMCSHLYPSHTPCGVGSNPTLKLRAAEHRELTLMTKDS